MENGAGASQAGRKLIAMLRYPANMEVRMGRFELIFDGDDIASSRGSAWVGVRAQTYAGRLVITHDCGSPAELKSAVRDLKAELDDIVERSRTRFERNLREKISKGG